MANETKSGQAAAVVVETKMYNERRYGRPWIAVVTKWDVGARPVLSFGAWLGRDGQAGQLEIKAAPGSIVRHGQKDYRGGKGIDEWAIVEADGSLRDVTQVEARAWWLALEAAAEVQQ